MHCHLFLIFIKGFQCYLLCILVCMNRSHLQQITPGLARSRNQWEHIGMGILGLKVDFITAVQSSYVSNVLPALKHSQHYANIVLSVPQHYQYFPKWHYLSTALYCQSHSTIFYYHPMIITVYANIVSPAPQHNQYVSMLYGCYQLNLVLYLVCWPVRRWLECTF